jgi:hypothetical protein
MKKVISAVFFALFVLVSANCAYKQRVLYTPEAIAVHQSSNLRSSVRAALKSYEWIIEKDSPGMIVARQSRRSHMARVKVTYGKGGVNIQYVDSENLLYGVDEEGQSRIHSTYNRWIQNLERAIASRVS